MKKIIFLAFIILLSLQVKSQNLFSITPKQAGTIMLDAKNISINLSDEIKMELKDSSLEASYYVVFTPIDNAIIPFVSNKTNNSFAIVVQSKDSLQVNTSIDYIVFVKRKVMQLSSSKKASVSTPRD